MADIGDISTLHMVTAYMGVLIGEYVIRKSQNNTNTEQVESHLRVQSLHS